MHKNSSCSSSKISWPIVSVGKSRKKKSNPLQACPNGVEYFKTLSTMFFSGSSISYLLFLGRVRRFFSMVIYQAIKSENKKDDLISFCTNFMIRVHSKISNEAMLKINHREKFKKLVKSYLEMNWTLKSTMRRKKKKIVEFSFLLLSTVRRILSIW